MTTMMMGGGDEEQNETKNNDGGSDGQKDGALDIALPSILCWTYHHRPPDHGTKQTNHCCIIELTNAALNNAMPSYTSPVTYTVRKKTKPCMHSIG